MWEKYGFVRYNRASNNIFNQTNDFCLEQACAHSCFADLSDWPFEKSPKKDNHNNNSFIMLKHAKKEVKHIIIHITLHWNNTLLIFIISIILKKLSIPIKDQTKNHGHKYDYSYSESKPTLTFQFLIHTITMCFLVASFHTN